MEGVPEGIDPVKIQEAIGSTALVKAVDDLHIWAISSDEAALSCRLTLENCDLQRSTQLVAQLKKELKSTFGIAHATIETDYTAPPPPEEGGARPPAPLLP